MKRFVLFLLVGVLALSLYACGDAKDKAEEVKEEVKEEVEETSEGLENVEETSEEIVKDVEKTGEEEKDHLAELGFVEKDGLKEFVELDHSPVEGGGLRIQIDRDEQKIHMIKTDANGEDTKEYVTFYPNKKQAEKYKYVSMMGTGFYYYYDLENEELTKIEDDAHEDKTESTKEAGRFDSAVEDMKEEIEKLTKYFEDKFGKMEEIIK